MGSSNGNSNINAVGGLGGYSVGTITLSKTQKVYIYSGGKDKLNQIPVAILLLMVDLTAVGQIILVVPEVLVAVDRI